MVFFEMGGGTHNKKLELREKLNKEIIVLSKEKKKKISIKEKILKGDQL